MLVTGLRTRGSWVRFLPGAPKFKHLASLRDFSTTSAPFATRKSVIVGVPFAADIRFVAAISSPISAAE